MSSTVAAPDSSAPGLEQILISADSHIVEEPDFWVNRLPAHLREQAPPPYTGVNRRATKGLGDYVGGLDPTKRIAEMAVDGVSAEVLYPTAGLFVYNQTDVALQQACFIAYNDWIIEYCRAATEPERLVGLGMISLYDIDHAVRELERCRKNGLRGAMIWQTPPASLSFTSQHYERFWEAAQAIEMPVSMHSLTGFGWARGGGAGVREMPEIERIRGNCVNIPAEAGNAVLDLIVSGVNRRYPRLQFVMVESEIGWLPFFLDKLDFRFKRVPAGTEIAIDRPPSEYFNESWFATFFNDPVGTRYLSWWGQENCMWSSDFPHNNSTWPHSREVIQRDLGHLSAEARQRITHGNVAALYHLDINTSTAR